MQFILASNNKKKLKEMGDILALEGCTVISMSEAGVSSDPEENGLTFEENALIKAKAAMMASGRPCIADDSGLSVDALGGAPGVFSARYCEGSDLDRTMFLLKNMESIEDRTARFVSAVACAFPDGSSIVVRGECEGEILHELKGDGGFGYDPVFYVPSEGCTFAEMPAERKNEISHRARAMVRFCEELRNKRNEE
ncbi:MAG: RdgB/HAM1 family non-canonical purine NTP pyrophosphatase [Clostridia bacterium]|nr:RdgB/HAM1 family non-canonical purine NTP pyrophosphatase [Clostridia bacterium]MBQ2326097.1 RdgB/HAM1 family non-canonical purine NTP pyrophosphatase [Clostridia bacterium]MBQ5813362.1 RdgB/HAM1 family non-canonical purine NTP pyrophosphatase [Clostridia bacterium]